MLVELSFQRVVLALQHNRKWRKVSVLVGSGSNWYQATRFPHIMEEDGATTGNDALDKQIRERAAEELIRLAAAKEVLDAGE